MGGLLIRVHSQIPRFPSFAAFYTGLALYQGLKYLFSSSRVVRRRIATQIKVLGILAIPLLMYATACPGTTVYFDDQIHQPPELWSWLGFFAYMLADVIALGVPQALIGELSAFQPPSVQAAINTFWIKSLMTLGIAGIFVSSIFRQIASTHTFCPLAIVCSFSIEGRYRNRLRLDLLNHFNHVRYGDPLVFKTWRNVLAHCVYKVNRAIAFWHLDQHEMSTEELISELVDLTFPAKLMTLMFPHSDDVWILHTHSLYAQGTVVNVIYDSDLKILIAEGADSSYELLDSSEFSDFLISEIKLRKRCMLMHCKNNALPNAPQQVQEVPLICKRIQESTMPSVVESYSKRAAVT